MKLNKDLEQARSKIEKSKTTINSLQKTHSEQLNALTDYKNKENQLEEEVRRLRSDNLALNKTLIDMTINTLNPMGSFLSQDIFLGQVYFSNFGPLNN